MVGKINQSKSVPMMSLNVVGNITQSNSRCLRRSPWVVSVGQVVVGKINQSKSVPMMSLNVVGNINQSNFRCLCGSLWVSAGGLHAGSLRGSLQVSTRSLWVVSVGGLCGWSLQVVSVGGLHGSLQVVSMGGLCMGGLCRIVSMGSLCRSLWVVSTVLQGSLCGWSPWLSVGLRGWWWGK